MVEKTAVSKADWMDGKKAEMKAATTVVSSVAKKVGSLAEMKAEK